MVTLSSLAACAAGAASTPAVATASTARITAVHWRDRHNRGARVLTVRASARRRWSGGGRGTRSGVGGSGGGTDGCKRVWRRDDGDRGAGQHSEEDRAGEPDVEVGPCSVCLASLLCGVAPPES